MLALELTIVLFVNIGFEDLIGEETLVWIPPAFAPFILIFSNLINAQMYLTLEHTFFPCLLRTV